MSTLSQIAASTATGSFSVELGEYEFNKFRALIREQTGISIGPEKRELMRTRLRRRLQALALPDYRSYYEYVSDTKTHCGELIELINCVTTNKTDFYREAHHFDFLRNTAFPEFVQRSKRTGNKKLRIWSAACSMGHEPYTIAMTVRDFFDSQPGWDAKILASDIDTVCLDKAAQGQYPEEQISCVPLEQKKRYFLRGQGTSAGQVSVQSKLRDLVTFRRINFADTNWPIHAQFDVIFCRNAMIYFERDFQQQLLKKFLRYLAPHGYLILGHSENVSWMTNLKLLGKTVYKQVEGTHPSSTTSLSNRNSIATPCPPAARKRAKHPIIAGEYYASRDPVEITTLLGSCIAACLYDPEVRVGGMNHFLIPEGNSEGNEAACYGIHAMELLINELMQLGADRSRMVARLYGGGNVMPGQLQSARIGEKNVDFVRKYLTTEEIPIVEQKVGGTSAMRVSMQADSGIVIASELAQAKVPSTLTQQDAGAIARGTDNTKAPCENQVTLF